MTHVVCIGLATLDTILAVPRHPGPDDRVVATELVVAGGGPAATAAVTLARLGVETHFVGAVGDDDVGRRIRAGLEHEGVDVSEVVLVTEARSPQSSILVGGDGRAIVHFAGTAHIDPGERARELCRTAAWVHVDHVGYAVRPTRSPPVDRRRQPDRRARPRRGGAVRTDGAPPPRGVRDARGRARGRRRARRRDVRRGRQHRVHAGGDDRGPCPRGRGRQHARRRRRLPRRPARATRARRATLRRAGVRERGRRALVPRARRALGDPDDDRGSR